MFYYGLDFYYIVLVLPAVALALFAQFHVKSTFARYSKTMSMSGLTGADAARLVLSANGVYGVQIMRVSGELTDHFDPKTNVIRLSDSVYASGSAAAIGVAAHEAGHAVQHASDYFPIRLRSAIIPVCQIGSNLAMPLILLGFIFGAAGLCELGVMAFALSTVFQVVTLPVEFNASSRAMDALRGCGRMSDTDLAAARKTLTAAALTYVAALAVSLANLLRLYLLVNGGKRRR